ncbi:MAG: sugar phosphate isomerase/epimerase [Phycisphaerales bacterium]|jgi:sugar phosphate isomerase/epimerase|nr:sugar phosphate isomerase/epimerase [Phycisphaerales bacterium]
MLKLAAFADEIGPDIDHQIQVCRDNSVMYFELRGADNKNVLDFDEPLKQKIRTKLKAAGMGVACIGSPIGKVKIDEPWEPHFEKFKVAVAMAEYFEAPYIRIFSYYLPEGKTEWAPYRDEILRRMRAKVDYVKDKKVILVLENESHIYGDTGQRSLDLLRTINHPKLRAAFDFANFVQVGDYPEKIWPEIQSFVVHFHIKDALRNKKNVPAGEGEGQIPSIVADAYANGYRGFLSLEPHLKYAGPSHGETDEFLFKVAADALKAICAKHKIPLAGVV